MLPDMTLSPFAHSLRFVPGNIVLEKSWFWNDQGCVKEATIPCLFFKENIFSQLNETKDEDERKKQTYIC